MRRRTLLPLIGSVVLHAPRLLADDRLPPPAAGSTTLATGPIELGGDWSGSLPHAALQVVSRMRAVCLAEVRLVSDRQPAALRVDNHPSGPPHVWLHFDGTPVGWVIVDIGPRDWCKLAYQFGHELGHVLCNSWGPDARPRNPCQWLEEALVESFSIRGLGRLADSWAADPPFPGDAAFAGAIRTYREELMARYRGVAAEQGAEAGLAGWFRTWRGALETDGGVGGPVRGAIPTVLAELTADPDGAAVEALGALNRWPGRSGVPMEDYLRRWKRSCAEVGASQLLPIRLRRLLLG